MAADAISVKPGVFAMGMISMVYGIKTTELQSARRTNIIQRQICCSFQVFDIKGKFHVSASLRLIFIAL